jgi:hypothetical protein
MDNFAIIRIFYKGDKETHSVEFKDSYFEAQQRYYGIIAADLANPDVTYQAAYIIDARGLMLDGKVFDRTPEPEPEEEA